MLQINSCLWGGIYNPIIPVCQTLPKAWRREPYPRKTGSRVTDGYLAFFQPDVFVEAEPGMAAKIGVESDARYIQERRVMSLEEFVTEDEVQRSDFAFGLNIFDLYHKLWREEFQFAPTRQRRLTLTEDKSKDSLFVDAIAGTFPTDDRLAYIRNGYVDAFKSQLDKPDANHLLEIVKGSFRTPLQLTTYEIDQWVDRSRGPLIFVVDPSSSLDIIDLWNLRLYRGNVLPIRFDWLDLHRDYLRKYIEKNHRLLPGNRNGVMIVTTVEVGRSIDPVMAENKLKGSFAGLPKGSWVTKFFYDAVWEQHYDDAVSRPRNGSLESAETSLDLVVDGEKEPVIKFRSLFPDFAERYSSSSARWVNVLNLNDYSLGRQWAIDLPSTTKKDSFARLRTADPILVSREGFVLRQRYKNHLDSVRLLTGRRAIVDWLDHQGITATPSDSGRIAEQLIVAVGGIWGARLFANEPTLRLLDDMAKSTRTFDESGTVEEYRDRTASAEQWANLIRMREAGRCGLPITVDTFVESGALRLGLEISCPNCGNRNWYGITAIRQSVSCERCLKKYTFPQGSINIKQTPWRFRVAGPFALPNFAGGAYTTVLALRCLSHGIGLSQNSLTYSTSLNLDLDGSNVEVDFAGWFRRESHFGEAEEPRFFIGEAKSFANEAFTDRDIVRMKEVAKKLQGACIIFAVLKQTLSPAEKIRIKRLATWGRFRLPNGRQRAPLIVLTGKELLSDRPIRSIWEDSGGKKAKLLEHAHKRLDNLDTLADFTQQIYLDMQGYWSWVEAGLKRASGRAKGKP